MNLAPSLTWMHLFPSAARFECAGAPAWFEAMVRARSDANASRQSESVSASARVLITFGTCDVRDDASICGMVAINAKVSTANLKSAGFTHIRRFAVLPSLQHPRWFISLDGGAVAAASFDLYTPARRSAHMKKSIARLAARFRVLGRYRDTLTIASRAPSPIERKLDELLPGRDVRLALSAGAPEPARNRKASAVALASDGSILAFVKISASSISRRILEHEAQVLPLLSAREGLSGLTPELVFSGEIDGRYLTVQSPLPGHAAAARMTRAHREFLAALRGPVRKPAAKTAMVADLSLRLSQISAADIARLNLAAALDALMPTLESLEVPSTVVHGDFAPWNLRQKDGRISAFDWEYGEIDGLPLIDETHFNLQLGYLLHDWDAARARQCLDEMAAAAPLGMQAHEVRAIHGIYLLDHLARLLGEGYEADHDMVAWYGRLLALLKLPRRETALV